MTPENRSAIDEMTDEQFQKRVSEILTRELGPAGYARFLRTCAGAGNDYTRDRNQWLGRLTVDDIMRQIKERRDRPA